MQSPPGRDTFRKQKPLFFVRRDGTIPSIYYQGGFDMRQFLILLSLLFLSASQLLSQGVILAEIRDTREFEVKSDGFTLDSPQKISIRAVVPNNRFRGLGSSAWILNAETREVVWKLRQAQSRSRSRTLAEYDDAPELPRGTYEAYFATYLEPGDNVEDFGDFVDFLAGRIFGGSRRSRDNRDMLLTIQGEGQRVAKDGVDRWHEQTRNNAIVSLTGLWDDRYEHRGFALEKPAEVTIYAIGEGRDEVLFDYGWIINAKTGARVWEMTDRNTRHAGGASKNRFVRETLKLPAGQYAAFFVTDGSHSTRDWNSAPPYDPDFWGLTIWLNDNALKKYVKSYEYAPPGEKNVIVSLTRIGDHESMTKSFTLKKATDVRILALGEGSGSDMADYGWITDAIAHRRVWTMEYDETVHAGGDRKNRMVDKTVHLDKGTYSVHFVTDGSHSYRDWNSSPPYDPERWGITLYAVGESFNQNDVVPLEEIRNPTALASIIRVGNDERRRQEFSLSQKSELHIYALGEASGREMADYAWIEDASSGDVVWEMRYKGTEHAGGARKNRLFDGTITLPAGNYLLFYETDDSHAYRDWNDMPPDDPESWGVTVSLAGTRR